MVVECVDGPCKGLSVDVPDDAEPGYEFEQSCGQDGEEGLVLALYQLEEGRTARWVTDVAGDEAIDPARGGMSEGEPEALGE